jgi:hypothetical protein
MKKVHPPNRNQSHETAPLQKLNRRRPTPRVYLIHYRFHLTHTTTVNTRCLPVKHTFGIFGTHSSTHCLAARISPSWCYDRPPLSTNWLAHVCDKRKLAPYCPTTMDRRSGIHAGLLPLISILSATDRPPPSPRVRSFVTA